jgi:hypothetical protein
MTTSQSFVGTGGTISGVGQFLKTVKGDIKIVLADPEGSGLYNKVSLGSVVIYFTVLLSLAPFEHLVLHGSTGLQARVGRFFLFVFILFPAVLFVNSSSLATEPSPPFFSPFLSFESGR